MIGGSAFTITALFIFMRVEGGGRKEEIESKRREKRENWNRGRGGGKTL